MRVCANGLSTIYTSFRGGEGLVYAKYLREAADMIEALDKRLVGTVCSFEPCELIIGRTRVFSVYLAGFHMTGLKRCDPYARSEILEPTQRFVDWV